MSINITIPNLPKFQSALRKSPQSAEKEIKKALEKSALQIVRETKPITPIDTGRLRTSIGSTSSEGILKIEKEKATIGSRVKYAIYVHRRVPFLERGAKQAENKIKGFFKDAIDNVFKKIARESK